MEYEWNRDGEHGHGCGRRQAGGLDPKDWRWGRLMGCQPQKVLNVWKNMGKYGKIWAIDPSDPSDGIQQKKGGGVP